MSIEWAAGLFEGEGCVNLAETKRQIQIHAQLSSTDKDVLDKFQQIVSLGNVRGPYPPSQPGYKLSWSWAASGRKAVTVLEQLLPLLCERRTETAEQCIKAYMAYVNSKTKSRPCLHCGTVFSPEFKAGPSHRCGNNAVYARKKLKAA